MSISFPRWAGTCLVIGLLWTACQPTREATATPPPASPAQDTVSVALVSQGSTCAIMTARSLWVKDQATWMALWREAFSDRWPSPDLPEIDFEKDQVLACFVGTCPNGGHQLILNQVSRSADTLRVHLTHVSPGPTCVTTDALTQPYVMVQIPRQKASEATFSTTQKMNDC